MKNSVMSYKAIGYTVLLFYMIASEIFFDFHLTLQSKGLLTVHGKSVKLGYEAELFKCLGMNVCMVLYTLQNPHFRFHSNEYPERNVGMFRYGEIIRRHRTTGQPLGIFEKERIKSGTKILQIRDALRFV